MLQIKFILDEKKIKKIINENKQPTLIDYSGSLFFYNDKGSVFIGKTGEAVSISGYLLHAIWSLIASFRECLIDGKSKKHDLDELVSHELKLNGDLVEFILIDKSKNIVMFSASFSKLEYFNALDDLTKNFFNELNKIDHSILSSDDIIINIKYEQQKLVKVFKSTIGGK